MPWRFLIVSALVLVMIWVVATPVLVCIGWTGEAAGYTVLVVNAVWLVITSALFVLRHGRWR